jgi:tRNA nucleotidyltransferase (CCA-adding enzyme)
MKIYLVGGAVRDQLLHLPVTEWDWVVVGAAPKEMIAQGYQAVGKDFPVFLHPTTKEEYALARTERKSGHGYKGFICDASSTVTLEEDLCRRDLTINAMAQDTDGKIIDPFGGRVDLAAGVLRHVSPAFAEDPVRVLRLARFAARFGHLGFTIAKETQHLVQQMASNGELAYLVPERVWQELQRALAERHPRLFFDTLAECGALKAIFPEISTAYSEENMRTLQYASDLSPDARIRLASLLQFMHPTVVRARCEHFRIPADYAELAILAAEYREAFQTCQTATPEELLQLLQNTDAIRRVQRFVDLLSAWKANSLLSHSDDLSDYLLSVQEAALRVNVSTIIQNSGLNGEALGQAISHMRLNAIDGKIASLQK